MIPSEKSQTGGNGLAEPEALRFRGSRQLAEAIVGGNTIGASAKLAGVSRRTAERRLADPAFRAYLQALRREAIGAAQGKLTAGATRAAERLAELVESESEQIALSASKALLELLLRVSEMVDLEERLGALERRVVLGDERPQPVRPYKGGFR